MSRKPKRITFSEIGHILDDSLNKADEARLAGFQELREFRFAKSATLEREHRRLAKKLGEDHPRVREIGARMDLEHRFICSINVGIDRVRTDPVEVDETGWTLHGRVYRADMTPAPGLRVALHDAKGAWIEQIGYSITDDSGYFSLFLEAPREVEREDDDVTLKVKRGWKLYAHVAQESGRVLHRGKEPIIPSLGKAEHREIVLDSVVSDRAPRRKKKASKKKTSSKKIVKKTGSRKKTAKKVRRSKR